MEQRATFDSVAELYDRVRPAYPDELVDDVLAYAGLQGRARAGRALEIGCGTGQATRAFAQRGLAIAACEPGENLAKCAAGNVAAFPAVSVDCTRFEEWPEDDPARRDFDVVMCAQAFHWLEPKVRCQKIARLLRPGGVVALFWNTPQRGEPALRDALDRIYADYGPAFASRKDEQMGQPLPPEEELAGSGCFGRVSVHRHIWRCVYAADDYVALMRTQSNHILLGEPVLAQLCEALRAAVEAHGGRIEVEYHARLYLAKTPAESWTR